MNSVYSFGNLGLRDCRRREEYPPATKLLQTHQATLPPNAHARTARCPPRILRRTCQRGEDREQMLRPPADGPTTSTDFESNAFRQCFWVHMGILSLLVIVDVFFDDAHDAAQFFFAGMDVVGVLTRVGLHMLPDQARAHRIGISIWAAINLAWDGATALGFHANPRRACLEAGLHKNASLFDMPMWLLFLVVMNSTFGLSFSRKSALVGLYLATWVLPGALACDARSNTTLQGVTLIAGSAVAHGVEMVARRDQLQHGNGKHYKFVPL